MLIQDGHPAWMHSSFSCETSVARQVDAEPPKIQITRNPDTIHLDGCGLRLADPALRPVRCPMDFVAIRHETGLAQQRTIAA